MSDPVHHQYDFTNMPMTPAQETVALLKEIRDLLREKSTKGLAGPHGDLRASETSSEHAEKIAKLQARVPAAKRK